MHRQLCILILLTFSIAVSACSGSAAADQGEQIDSIPTLDNAAWPTPVPATPAATATPFPRVSLAELVGEAKAKVEAEETAEDDEATGDVEAAATAVAEIDSAGMVEAAATVVAETGADALAEAAAAAGRGVVNSYALNLRSGPTGEAAKVKTLVQGDMVEIIGRGENPAWVQVRAADGTTGWVVASFLDIAGAVTAPVVAAESSRPAAAPQPEPVAVAEPAPVAALTGLSALPVRIDRSEVEVRSGPATDYAPIATLTDPQEAITLLGVDDGRQWALIEPAHLDSRTGWAAVGDLAGDFSAAPVVYTAWVESNGETVRSGPGIFHDPVGTLAINSLLQVHGINEARSWLLIQPLGGQGLGWVRLQNVTIHQPLDVLPPAPAPTFAAADAAAVPEMTFREEVAPGRLVFATASGGDIYTINSDGSSLRRLASGLDPVLSPDGQTVAFAVWDQGEAGNGTVRLIDIDGSNERVVHEFVKQPKGPAWSPDGARLVINYQNGGRLQAERSCHDAGRKPPINAYDINLSTSNRTPKLCWTVPPDPHWDLRVINLSDGSFEDYDGGTYAFRPAWDPVQPWRVVSDGGRGLLATDIDNPAANYILLTEHLNDGSPVFSPDGRFIAFSASAQTSGGGGHDIYRINRDGSGRVRLTQTPLWVSVQPDDAPPWNNVSPAWSPDNTQIAFLTDRSGRWEIWLMNADGSNPRPMFANGVLDDLNLTYAGVDERMLGWR